jgi:hypothetical protein
MGEAAWIEGANSDSVRIADRRGRSRAERAGLIIESSRFALAVGVRAASTAERKFCDGVRLWKAGYCRNSPDLEEGLIEQMVREEEMHARVQFNSASFARATDHGAPNE